MEFKWNENYNGDNMEDLESRLKEKINIYSAVSKQEKEIKSVKEGLRIDIEALIKMAGLQPGHKIASNVASLTVMEGREEVVSANFKLIEQYLGEESESFITKKLKLKELREAIEEGTVNADVLKLFAVERGEPTFTIRTAKVVE